MFVDKLPTISLSVQLYVSTHILINFESKVHLLSLFQSIISLKVFFMYISVNGYICISLNTTSMLIYFIVIFFALHKSLKFVSNVVWYQKICTLPIHKYILVLIYQESVYRKIIIKKGIYY